MSLTKDKKIWTPGALRPETKDLPDSGQISLSQIHVEAGGGGQSSCSINDSDIRGLINKGDATQMGFNEWYGASSAAEFATSSGRSLVWGGQGKRVVSLTGMGIQTGDLVFVSTTATSVGDIWGYTVLNGWTAMGPDQGFVNYVTGTQHYKVMGASPDTEYVLPSTEGSWFNSCEFPALVVVFRNAGSRTAHNSKWQMSSVNYIPGSIYVNSADSLHVISASREANAVAYEKPGWTQLSHGFVTLVNGGYESNRCHLWYKSGVPVGNSDISQIGWDTSEYGRINGAQGIWA